MQLIGIFTDTYFVIKYRYLATYFKYIVRHWMFLHVFLTLGCLESVYEHSRKDYARIAASLAMEVSAYLWNFPWWWSCLCCSKAGSVHRCPHLQWKYVGMFEFLMKMRWFSPPQIQWKHVLMLENAMEMRWLTLESCDTAGSTRTPECDYPHLPSENKLTPFFLWPTEAPMPWKYIGMLHEISQWMPCWKMQWKCDCKCNGNTFAC